MLKAEHIRTETFRRSPELNIVGTNVRAIHIPTGIFAEGCDERSYVANKLKAMNLLEQKLSEHLKGKPNA